jgi:peptidoglycan/LPS O-acetylase OafA/YrhL
MRTRIGVLQPERDTVPIGELVMNSGTSDFLNASRWIAAFFVVLGHVYHISIANYYHVVHPNLFLRGVNFLGEFGYMAVIVFFVISGFLVGGRIIINFKKKSFSVADYFVHRFSRIYTVLIPALIVGLTLDCLGIVFFNTSGIYNHPEYFYTNSFGNDITKHLGFITFVGNVLQLQTIVVSSLGSNGPLWSLANEWWYYVLFGFCMIAYRSGRLLTRVIVGGLIVAMLAALPLKISLWFVMWGIGVGIAVLDRYWTGWPFLVGAAILGLCLIAVRWMIARLPDIGLGTQFAMDLVVAFGFSIALLCAKNLREGRKFGSLHSVLASFSYTLYLVHFPAMVFIAVFLRQVFDIDFLQPPAIVPMIYAGGLLVILYGYAWIFATFTEAYTNAIRSRLSRAIPALVDWARFHNPAKGLRADLSMK